MSASTSEQPSLIGRPRAALATLGWLPALTLVAGAGLLLCSAANAMSRATVGSPEPLYWLGLVVIAVPIFYRLAAKEASYGERLGLVVVLGIALYGVKVSRDSLLYTFSDEFVHAFNAEQIVEHGRLYEFNPALPVTPRFPGLEGATSALMTLTGMSSFGAGIFLVGAARVAFMAGLFCLFARLSASARIAGLGVAIYTGTSNFLYWNAQYSYESLSLPLMVVVLMAIFEREAGPPEWRRSWLVPIVLGIAAIIVTHHLTSYALAVILVALALLYRLLRVERPNPWPLALFALGGALAWLLLAARSTIGYLYPVLEEAVKAIFKTAAGESAPRTLFKASSEVIGVTPVPARAVALFAVALLGIGFIFGIRQVWRRFRLRDPMVLLFAAASVAFFGALALRFAPAAWETGNRAGEFLFLGLAFVVAYGALEMLRPGAGLGRRRLLLASAIGVVMVGGAISGWAWDVQLARPLKITAEGATIESKPLALARWVSEEIPERRFAASEANSRLLLDPGGQVAFAGQGPDVEDILKEPELRDWQLPLLRRHSLRYVVGDRRQISHDTLRGYYFSVPGGGGDTLLPAEVLWKFDRIPVARIWDGGQLVLFDLKDRP